MIDVNDPVVAVGLIVTPIFVAAIVLTLAEGLRLTVNWIAEWRTRKRLERRLRKLPPPDDPRLRNVVSLRDWKNREKSESRFRSAA